MAAKSALLAPLVVALAFAGCTDGDAAKRASEGGPALAAPADDVVAEPVLDFAAGAPAPVWSVGDWWSYRVEYLGALPKTYDAKVVVYAEDSEAWYLTSDDRELVLRAGFNHYPTLGKVKKADLHEFIHDVEVSYFAWPLKNGTRTGTYRDFEAEWTVTAAVLDTGKGPVPGFATVMRRASDGAVILHHGYSPLTKWFTNLSFAFRGGEPVDLRFTLQDWGSNFTGELPVVAIVDKVHRMFPVLDAAAPGAPGAQAHEPFRNEQGTLLVGSFWGGAPGSYDFCVQLATPAQGSFRHCPTDPAPQSDAANHFSWTEMAGVPGDWLAYGTAVTQGGGFLFGEVYELHDATVTLPAA